MCVHLPHQQSYGWFKWIRWYIWIMCIVMCIYEATFNWLLEFILNNQWALVIIFYAHFQLPRIFTFENFHFSCPLENEWKFYDSKLYKKCEKLCSILVFLAFSISSLLLFSIYLHSEWIALNGLQIPFNAQTRARDSFISHYGWWNYVCVFLFFLCGFFVSVNWN